MSGPNVHRLPSRHEPGVHVRIGGASGITAIIEEVIWPRNMVSPFYLIEYRHEGHLISCRVHSEDCE